MEVLKTVFINKVVWDRIAQGVPDIASTDGSASNNQALNEDPL